MELKIKNGDYVLDERGSMQRLSGSAELIQRVLYKLTARREGFPFIPQLGSELYQLSHLADRERSSAAEQAVREALKDEPDLEVTDVQLTDSGDSLYMLTVHLSYHGQDMELSLTIQ